MAGADLSPSGTASSALAGGYQGIIAKGRDLEGKADKPPELLSERVKSAGTKRDETIARLEDERARIGSAPTPQQPTEAPEYHPTDPVKAWGSSAMFIAMFGSLLTRTPMTTALNAAASAMKAFHQRDMDEYNIQFKKWQVASTNAAKMYEYQVNAYNKIITEIDRREGLTEKQFADENRAAYTEAMSLAMSFKDEAMATMLQRYGVDGMRMFIRDQQNHIDKMQINAEKIEEGNERIQRRRELEQSDAWKEHEAAAKKGDMSALNWMIEQQTKIADPRYAMLTPAQKIQATLHLRDKLVTTPVGKAYNDDLPKWATIDNAAAKLAKGGNLNTEEASTLLEVGQRVLTNQAVRIGLVNLQLASASYFDTAAREISRFKPNEGSKVPRNLQVDTVNILEKYKAHLHELEINEVEDARTLGKSLGLDPDEVANPRYHPTREGGVDGTRGTQPVASYGVPQPLATDHGFTSNVSRIFGGKQVVISSHYRPHSSGSSTSEHMEQGPGVDAYDFHVQGMPFDATAMTLAANMINMKIPFDQILIEGNHVHVGWGPHNRQQLAVKPQPGHTPVFNMSEQSIIEAQRSGKITYAVAGELLKHYYGYD